MSDQNKFINAYVEQAVNSLHEQVNIVLKQKTELKLTNDLVQEKDQVIKNLESQLSSAKDNANEIENLRTSSKNWEDQYNVMKNKVSHMDTLSAQFNDLKGRYVVSETENNKLKEENINFKNEVTSLTEQLSDIKNQ